MTRYLIKFETDDADIRASQSSSASILAKAGVSYLDRKWKFVHSDLKSRFNAWDVRCTDEQLLMITLLGGIVIENITEKLRQSGMSKLTYDEQVALGLKRL